MKKSILTILTALFVLTSCKSFKKIFERSEATKSTKESKERVRDSVYSLSETLPSTNLIVLTEEDFKLRGDFEQSVSSGKNKTTIKKQNGKVYVRSENSGNTSTNSTTRESNTNHNSYVETFVYEYKRIVKKMPLRYYIYIFIILLIWQRKLFSQILVAIFPNLAAKRIFKLFLGQKLD